MALEKYGAEAAVVECAAALDWAAPKFGWEGWPDRMIIWSPGRHFWVEAKTSKGRLTPAQKVRIKWLRVRGEMVFIPESRGEVVTLFALLV